MLTAAERMTLKDYLFTEVALAAGARSLVVQIHTGNGDGPYFNNQRANPGLLENALASPPLQKTNFVLVHGGWPFTSSAQAMLDKPNTYADFSAQTFYLTTHALAEVLRNWLGWHPEKVLFGTDACSDVDSPLTGYEEKEWLMTFKARQALAIALTAMMRDGEISRPRAVEIARMVMRENAMSLYRLTGSGACAGRRSSPMLRLRALAGRRTHHAQWRLSRTPHCVSREWLSRPRRSTPAALPGLRSG